MKNVDVLLEEYKITYDNYKFTFQEYMDIAKFYMTIISILIVGFIISGKNENTYTEISAFVILIIIGIMCILFQNGIIERRKKCVRRLNYLREELFRKAGETESHDYYVKLSGFSKTDIDKWSFSKKGPVYFTFLLIISLSIYVIYLICSI